MPRFNDAPGGQQQVAFIHVQWTGARRRCTCAAVQCMKGSRALCWRDGEFREANCSLDVSEVLGEAFMMKIVLVQVVDESLGYFSC